ncbi:hypothetical protein E1287_15570 [Actinomadura sp. KC06]|uniref:hypothetical protein n=1 Tax=Actinomadura sp. KC06 TaxID=2530369 RepID=UPI0010520C36|nr:hypothetical protein [Actinomadura sp. KC06]TDD34753.1 hypothetical protein E1287_15570 [Actinomadura sp. KC06]
MIGTYISLTFGIVGAIPVCVSAAYLVTRWRKVRRVLRFQPSGRVDLVLTTSHRQLKSQGGKVAVVRHLAPEGDILAIAAAAAAISKNYRSKKIVTHVSERVRGPLDDDLIILGSPVSNRYCADLLDRLSLVRSLDLELDIPNGDISINRPGGSRFEVNGFDIRKGSDGLPRRDLLFIATATNPYNADRRAVICAGFTTYGTGAAGEILFTHILGEADSRCSELRRVIECDSSFLIIECGLEFGKLIHWEVLYRVDSDEEPGHQ